MLIIGKAWKNLIVNVMMDFMRILKIILVLNVNIHVKIVNLKLNAKVI